MRVSFKHGFVTLCFFFTATIALAANREVKIHVQLDNESFQLSKDSKKLRYRDNHSQFDFEIKNCNRKIIEKFWNSYEAARSTSLRDPLKIKSRYNFTEERNGKELSVTRGSSFGTYLRNFPNKMIQLTVESSSSCTSQAKRG